MSDERVKEPFSAYRREGTENILPPHYHAKSMEFFRVGGAAVKVQIGTLFVDANPGDIFYVPEGMIHRVDGIEGAAAVEGVVFETESISHYLASFDSELFYMFAVQAQNRLIRLDSTHPIYTAVNRFFTAALNELRDRDVCYGLAFRSQVFGLMAAMLRHYCAAKNDADRAVYHNVLRLRPVIRYIMAHYQDKLYIDDLSSMIQVSADYFTKMFRDSIGKTPIDYINGLRINRALILLRNPELTLSEISDEVGFCNPNYFHKIFKQYMDTSPLVYRKSGNIVKSSVT